jgi:hypothetical protein
MSDRVYINYQGVDAFYPQPTPFIGVEMTDIYYGERWGQQETFTLQGVITGCSYSGIVTAQRDLLNRFNKSYQTLQIYQQTGVLSSLVYSKPLTQVESITFAQARMFGAQDYTITLTCYPSGLFSGAFGILEPQDTWDFKEQQDATLDATHTISCKAFNTSAANSNALDNARVWAFGRTGLASVVSPIFINGVNPSDFCLVSQAESIDRFNGTYSLVESYSSDLARTGYGVIRYTADIQSGNNLITVALNGTAQGCGRNISGIRASFGSLDKTAIAALMYRDAFGMTDLNPTPTSQSFTEDPFLTRIEFAYVYDNDNSPDISFDYSVDLSTATNGAITAAIQGTVRARGGNLSDKLVRTQAYADTVNLYNLVVPFYTPFDVSSVVPLNVTPITSGRAINQSDGTVQLNATFSNQEDTSVVLDHLEYTLSFLKATQKVDAKPILNGLGTYSLVNLGFANRASLSINGTAVVNAAYTSAQGIAEVKTRALALLAQYGLTGSLTLDQNDVTTTRTDDKTLSFTFTWSFDGTVSGPTAIGTLAI